MSAKAPLLGVLLTGGLLAGSPALAQQGGEAPAPPPLAAVPERPDIPQRVHSGQPLDLPPQAAPGEESAEPEVTIIRKADQTITEYRVNGILRAIKVEPDGFPAYYLVDTDGNGRVDTRTQRWAEKMLIPQWVLFEW